MITLRQAEDIYHVEGGWFSARWHFSFDHYHDPEFMGFGPLRVFNDDRLIPGAIWPMHPHRDIEGITYVVEGLFEHADSLGNNGHLLPGAVQRATLGSGMQHSERNGSTEKPMRFLQFWILPETPGLPPSLEQRQYTREDRTNRLLKVLDPEGADALKVHQDARASTSRTWRRGSAFRTNSPRAAGSTSTSSRGRRRWRASRSGRATRRWSKANRLSKSRRICRPSSS